MQHKITWSKIILGTTILVGLLSTPHPGLAQDTIRLTISHKNDSTFCSSLLGHQQFLIHYHIPAHLEEKVYYNPRHFEIQFRINDGPWRPSRRIAGYSFTTSIYGAPTVVFGAYLDYFLDTDTLSFIPFNNKVLIEARLRASLTYNNLSANYYSNVDSVFVDIPTLEDRSAFQYLAALKDTIYMNEFVWMQIDLIGLGSQYYFLRDSFPNTILSDIARYDLWVYRYDTDLQTKNELTEIERNYLLDTYQQLLNSKSTYIRMLAKEYYGYGMNKKLE